MNRLRRYYEIKSQLKSLTAEADALKSGFVQEYGTGTHQVGNWILKILSFTTSRFDREAAEAELGTLARFETPQASIRVDVKPDQEAILEAVA